MSFNYLAMTWSIAGLINAIAPSRHVSLSLSLFVVAISSGTAGVKMLLSCISRTLGHFHTHTHTNMDGVGGEINMKFITPVPSELMVGYYAKQEVDILSTYVVTVPQDLHHACRELFKETNGCVCTTLNVLKAPKLPWKIMNCQAVLTY